MTPTKSAIRAVMLDEEPPPVSVPVTAYTPPAVSSPSSPEPRWAMLTAVTLAVVAGIVVFAVVNTRPPKPTALTQSMAPIIQERIVERVITATPQPTSQPTEPPAPVVTVPPPPVVAQPAAQVRPAQRQPARSLPAPTPVQPAAWPAPTGTAKGSMGYLCADGRYFPADDGRWAFGPFGQWHMEGSGDRVDIRDSLENNRNMGWHYGCQRIWR